MSSYVRNFSTVLLGNTFAQAVGILFYPLLTRLYSPAEMGVYSIILAIILTLGRIIHMDFSDAIIIPDSDREAQGLVVLSLCTMLGVSIVICILVFIVANSPLLLERLSIEASYAQLLWFIPICSILTGFLNIQNNISVRHKRFTNFSLSRAAESLFDRCGALFAGVLQVGVTGLFIGKLVGLLSGSTVQARYFPKLFSLTPKFSFNEFCSLAKKYKDFPLFGQWVILVSALANQLPLLLMGFFFGAANVGFLALGHRVIQTPLIAISDAVHKVYLPQAARVINSPSEISSLTITVLRYLSILVMPGIVILAFFGEELIAIIFGQRWSEAGVYVQILFLTYFLGYLMQPLYSIFILKKRQKINLIFSVLSVVATCGSFMIAKYIDVSDKQVLLCYAISKSIVFILHIITACIGAEIALKSLARLAIRICIELSPLIICLYLLNIYIGNIIVKFTLVIIAAIAYYGGVIAMDSTIKQFFMSKLNIKGNH